MIWSWSITLVVVDWILRLIMIFVLLREPPRPSIVAWLVLVLFLPWLGCIVYLLIGSKRMSYQYLQRYEEVQSELPHVRGLLEKHVYVETPNFIPELMNVVRLAERLGKYRIVGGNRIDLIIDTDETVDALVRDIDNAKHHVHLMMYIYGADETGEKVADALARAVQRGVVCRVLVDAAGSRPMLRSLAPRMRNDGVVVHAMLQVKLHRLYRARIDLRNHRKLVVVDGEIAYTGSQNIVNADYGVRNLQWHDLMARVEGPIVLQLQSVFMTDWYVETKELIQGDPYTPEPQRRGNVLLQTLPSGPVYETENYQRLIVAAIHAAEREVIITTPYFVPDDSVMEAIEVAILRGVTVQLIVPRYSDQYIVAAAGRAFFAELLRIGVEVYLFEMGLVHSKTVAIDRVLSFIGTSNFDIRSFALNFEVSLVIYSQTVTQQLNAVNETHRSKSTRLTDDQWTQRSTPRRMLDNLARLMSPVL